MASAQVEVEVEVDVKPFGLQLQRASLRAFRLLAESTTVSRRTLGVHPRPLTIVPGADGCNALLGRALVRSGDKGNRTVRGHG